MLLGQAGHAALTQTAQREEHLSLSGLQAVCLSHDDRGTAHPTHQGAHLVQQRLGGFGAAVARAALSHTTFRRATCRRAAGPGVSRVGACRAIHLRGTHPAILTCVHRACIQLR